jgi:hypothetical protein
LLPQLSVGVNGEVAAEQCAQVFWTEVHFQGLRRFARECLHRHAAHISARRARSPLRRFDERIAFALDNCFLACGAIDFAGNRIPTQSRVAATATRLPKGKSARGRNPHTIHGCLPAKEKAECAARRRNPRVVTSPVVSAKIKIKLTKSGPRTRQQENSPCDVGAHGT